MEADNVLALLALLYPRRVCTLCTSHHVQVEDQGLNAYRFGDTYVRSTGLFLDFAESTRKHKKVRCLRLSREDTLQQVGGHDKFSYFSPMYIVFKTDR